MYKYLRCTASCRIAAKNEVFLYQHSARCSTGLQLFLDSNPEYWCLVPMTWDEAREADTNDGRTSEGSIHRWPTVRPPQSSSPAASTKRPRLFENVLTNTTRSEDECSWLCKGVPKPPSGYRFSRRQVEEQMQLFKFKTFAYGSPPKLVDFYLYTIVAVRMYLHARNLESVVFDISIHIDFCFST